MKETELRNYNSVSVDVPFGNYKFAKSSYVVISWHQIITKSAPGDGIGKVHARGETVLPFFGRGALWPPLEQQAWEAEKSRSTLIFLTVFLNAC